jgi:hypothetical protein
MRTTEMIPSFVALSELPLIVIEDSMIETAIVLAPLPTETPSEPQGLVIVLASAS